MKQIFNQHLKNKYPDLNAETLEQLVSVNLLSPYKLELPKSILQQAREFISAVFSLRQDSTYKKIFQTEIDSRKIIDPGNKAICMSYDFHVDDSGNLKLIEINTNAAFLALGYEYYESQRLAQPVAGFDLNQLKENIETELQLFGRNVAKPVVSIIDENPSEQRLYIEFLVYQAMMKAWGWQVKIEDFRALSEADFVYNRYTDFFFENEVSAKLREKYNHKTSCFSPNPFEYLMLADKQRMIDWWDENFWQAMGPAFNSNKEIIQKHLPEAFSVNADKLEEAWNRRKNFFFKPKRAYGSKQSYRGSSMSRRILEDIAQGDFIAQEFIPAAEVDFASNENSKALLGNELSQKFKYDLRFYTYQDQLQMVIARLYQGQATNAKTLGGGFAPIIFY